MSDKILNNNEVEDVKNVLRDAEDKSLYAKIEKETNESTEVLESITQDSSVTFFPNGERIAGDLEINETEESINAEIERISKVDIDSIFNVPEDANDIEIDEDVVVNQLDGYGIAKEELPALMEVIKRYRAGDELKFKDLEAVPSLQGYINNIIKDGNRVAPVNVDYKRARNSLTTMMLDSIVQDSKFDRISLDFNRAMAEAYDLKPLVNLLKEDVFKNFLPLFEEAIEKAKAKEDVDSENILKLQAIKLNYVESYELVAFKEFIVKNPIKKYELKKIVREMEQFNLKYKRTSFSIEDIKKIPQVLHDLYKDNISEEVIYAFVLLFIKFTSKMDPRNPIDHAFVSYFIINILNFRVILPITDYEALSTFPKTVLDNLTSAIDLVKIK